MASKRIKIPKGEITLLFEGGLESTISDEMLMQFIIGGVQRMGEERPPRNQTTYEQCYDDENPNYITGTEDGI